LILYRPKSLTNADLYCLQINSNITLTYIHYSSDCYLNPQRERERERDASLNTNEAPRYAHAHSLQPHWRAAVKVTIYSLTPH